MKSLIVSIILFFWFTSCSYSSLKSNEKEKFSKTVNCLNNNVFKSNAAVQNLIEIADTLLNYNEIGLFHYKSYSTTGSLNKETFQFNIEYYFSEDINSVIELHKKLDSLQRIELSLLRRRKISRVGEIIVCITISRLSESLEVSLVRIFSDIYLNYINHCN